MINRALALVCLTALCGCGKDTQSNGEGSIAPAVAAAVSANNAFSVDLYRHLSAGPGNLFFSPFSMSTALAMTAEGARGDTALQMGEVLRYPQAARRPETGTQAAPWDMSLIHGGFAALTERLTARDPSEEATVRNGISKLRATLEAANRKVERERLEAARLEGANEWQDYYEAGEEAARAAAALNEALARLDRYELRVANALWGEQTYPFRASYIETISTHFGTSGVFPADFKNSFPAERVRINGWVAEQTQDRIHGIIPELPPGEAQLMRLILVNAIYFKGEWSEPFQANATKLRDFFLASGKVVKTPTMMAPGLEVGRYAAFEGTGAFFATPRQIERGQTAGLYPGENGFAILELPYKGGALSMIVLVPRAIDGLGTIEATLTADKLNAWTSRLEKREIDVLLPRFKLETDYQLGEKLKAMGMVRAFTDPRLPEGADFGGMSDAQDPMRKLYISKVLHKAFVEVNEKGTEAAAATAVMMPMAGGMPPKIPFVPVFFANRPFLFLIWDQAEGAILFMGRVSDPTQPG